MGKFVLLKIKNDVYRLRYVEENKIDTLKNYIILHTKENITYNIILHILKYKINILNFYHNKEMIKVLKNNDIKIMNIDYITFLKFISQLKTFYNFFMLNGNSC